MNKEQFLLDLASALSGLPDEDIEQSLEYYSEMIDDRVEDGLSEEEAVADLGSIGEIRAQIIKDTPIAKIVKKRVKTKRALSGLEITLLIVGFPIWFSLLVAAFSAAFSIYISLWAVLISLYAVNVCFFVCPIGGLIAAVADFATGNPAGGLFFLGSSLLCVGIGILWIYLCKWSTRGLVWLGKVSIKSLFIRKEKRK